MEMRVSIQATGALFDGRSQAIINDQLTQYMYEATQYWEHLVKQFTPQGVNGERGVGLVNTVAGEVIGKGTPVQKGVIMHTSLHGDVIERGRTPGKKMPPEGTMLRWIQLKMGVSEAEAKSIEFLVRRKIGRKGFPGAHMFEKAFTQGYPTVAAMAEARGFKISQELSL